MTGSDGHRRRWIRWLAYEVNLGELTARAQRALRDGAPIRPTYDALRASFSEAGFKRTCENRTTCGRRFLVASSRDDRRFCSAACRQRAYAARQRAAQPDARPEPAGPPAPPERAVVVRWGAP